MNSINLDDYLADLGISQGDEAPPTATVLATPGLSLCGHPNMPGTTTPGTSTFHTSTAAFEHFMQGLLAHLDGEYQVNVQAKHQDGHDILEAEITGEKAAKLPGQRGQILQAMEVLAYATLTRQFGSSDLKIRIDAGGYRQRQANTLASLAQRLAAQVAKTGEAHELQPMNASERRLIHMALKDHPMVLTESRGEGKGRHLVILPKQ